MSFEIQWRSELQAIYLKMAEVVTPAEVMDMNRATIALAQEHPAPIHIIIDTLAVTEIPTNLRWVLQMMLTNPASPTGWNIVVQKNPLIQLMASIILRVLRVPFHFCATMDEAIAFLSSHSSHFQMIEAVP